MARGVGKGSSRTPKADRDDDDNDEELDRTDLLGPADEDEYDADGVSIPKPQQWEKDGDKRAFIKMLASLDGAKGMIAVASQAQMLAKALKERARLIGGDASGTLTLTLSFEADKEGAVAVSFQSKVRTPDRRGGTTVFYVTDEGTLVKDNPLQGQLFEGPKRGKTFYTNPDGSVVPDRDR
jgi:hypothetical protein